MANKTLFSNITSFLPRADTYNEAAGQAYKLTPKHALAQIAATAALTVSTTQVRRTSSMRCAS